MTHEADHDLIVRIDERVGAIKNNLQIVTSALHVLETKVSEHIQKEDVAVLLPARLKLYLGILIASGVAVAACVGEILRRWHP